MKISILLIILSLYCTTINAQIISQFTWDSSPVTQADIGPDATSVSASATSDVGGVGGTNGLNAGLPKKDIDFIIPTGSGIFDVAGIDISFDYQRDEASGTFLKRGNSLTIDGTSKLSVIYKVEDGVGGSIQINSGNAYSIPDDNIFRNYRFYYLPATGYGALLVDGVEVWNSDGDDNRDMFWDGAGDISIGENMDGSGSNRTFLDNLIIASVTVSPLPIELISFNVKQINTHALIEWQTVSEINNDFFTLEKSMDGTNWEYHSRIAGAGNSNSLLNYKTTDKAPFLDISYYRLKQTDFDGKYSYSEVKSFKYNDKVGNSIKISPNPVTDQITISSNNLGINDIHIYNAIGQDVTRLTKFKNNTERSTLIDLSNLENGMYFIKVNAETTKIYKK